MADITIDTNKCDNCGDCTVLVWVPVWNTIRCRKETATSVSTFMLVIHSVRTAIRQVLCRMNRHSWTWV